MQPCQVQFILLSKSWHSLTGDRPVHYQDLNPLSSTELQTPCVSPGEAVGQILHLPSALMKVQTVGKLTLVCESCPANATELILFVSMCFINLDLRCWTSSLTPSPSTDWQHLHHIPLSTTSQQQSDLCLRAILRHGSSWIVLHVVQKSSSTTTKLKSSVTHLYSGAFLQETFPYCATSSCSTLIKLSQ